ncbi:MAG: ParB N-terminal domain-containing protein, partial [Acidobacteria bacterium]|nr:ParB N-terminal domain-containing protein [Acidobacteriota bacterium]
MEVKHMVIVAITVGDRTRKNIGDLVGLKESIQAVGLLHPIVVNSAGELISGLRRMRAFQELGR